jgi:hypothetical protein
MGGTLAENAYSSDSRSELVKLFAERAYGSSTEPSMAMIRLVRQLRRSRPRKEPARAMEYFLHSRKILRIDHSPDLDCDGIIRPLGNEFNNGFQIAVNSRCTLGRYRFTVAHELCHTFFYELVPELKFRSHGMDEHEERICNLGAAELLMPPNDVRGRVRGLSTSLDSLKHLASAYMVSIEAMLLRLRSLGLWDSELTVWHRMTGGTFSLRRIVGGRKAEWAWSDGSIPQKAWDTGRSLSGRTYVQCATAGGRLFRDVSFELVRQGMSLISLWSRPLSHPKTPRLPLFPLK